DDDIAEAGVTTARATENANREQRLGARVVGDLNSGFLLKHFLSLIVSRPGGLLSLLEDLDQAPALGRAERTGLADNNQVANAGRVVLVVHLALLGAADDLAVQRVLYAVFDLDDDGLIHLVAG